MNGHPRDQAKVPAHCRWPLIRGTDVHVEMSRGIDNVAVHSRWPLTTGVALLRWFYTSDGVKRFVALSRASQMRVKALAAYLLPTPASARVKARPAESVARRQMQHSSTVLNFRASRQQFSQSCAGVKN